jgi:hypothetical protein
VRESPAEYLGISCRNDRAGIGPPSTATEMAGRWVLLLPEGVFDFSPASFQAVRIVCGLGVDVLGDGCPPRQFLHEAYLVVVGELVAMGFRRCCP